MQAHNVDRATVLADRLGVAATLWTRFKGLMGRPPLAPGEGLWLTGTNGIHMFFMRFPIDAVFLGKADPDGLRTVLSVHRGLRPWLGLVPLVRGAEGVLELPAGSIDQSGTVPGDRIRLS